tara:strand:+ start:397 stop:723 length:327 start_codon:yes stop_codon:yes gene_type:complete
MIEKTAFRFTETLFILKLNQSRGKIPYIINSSILIIGNPEDILIGGNNMITPMINNKNNSILITNSLINKIIKVIIEKYNKRANTKLFEKLKYIVTSINNAIQIEIVL